jgi:nucleoside-diphosphate-sugar epimerase
MKKALVCGAGGFIGAHMVNRLKNEGFWVRGVDLKLPEFANTTADDFVIGDLCDARLCEKLFDDGFDEVYQFAADMGGAGYIFTGDNDARVMFNSASINLNIVEMCRKHSAKRVFFSSSACIYPAHNQEETLDPITVENSAYPASPDSDYGWEKLFSERLYAAYARNYDMCIRVARYHNIFGPEGTWDGGKEKAPAALCRKVAAANNHDKIEIWGDGIQTRSFLFIDDCIEATIRLMRNTDFEGPVNIGSEEMVSINELAKSIIEISGKKIELNHIYGPQGVRGRNSHNDLIKEKLLWQPEVSLLQGLKATYPWIESQVAKNKSTLAA